VGIRSFMKSVMRILKVSRKPSKATFMNSLKITLLGLLILGSVGFAFQITAMVFSFVRIVIPKIVIMYALVIIAVIVLAVVAYMRARSR